MELNGGIGYGLSRGLNRLQACDIPLLHNDPGV
jgi:hypothetical protein